MCDSQSWHGNCEKWGEKIILPLGIKPRLCLTTSSLIILLTLVWLVVIDTILNLNPLNAELNPICYLLALLGAHHFLHVSRIRVKLLTLR